MPDFTGGFPGSIDPRNVPRIGIEGGVSFPALLFPSLFLHLFFLSPPLGALPASQGPAEVKRLLPYPELDFHRPAGAVDSNELAPARLLLCPGWST